MPDTDEYLREGRRYEGHGVLDRALERYELAASESSDPAIIAEALTHKSRVHRCRSEWDLALASAREARGLAESAHLHSLLIEATIAEANVLMCRGDFNEALAMFRSVLDGSTDARV